MKKLTDFVKSRTRGVLELSRIFHGKDHRAGIVAFRRGGFPLLNLILFFASFKVLSEEGYLKIMHYSFQKKKQGEKSSGDREGEEKDSLCDRKLLEHILPPSDLGISLPQIPGQ